MKVKIKHIAIKYSLPLRKSRNVLKTTFKNSNALTIQSKPLSSRHSHHHKSYTNDNHSYLSTTTLTGTLNTPRHPYIYTNNSSVNDESIPFHNSKHNNHPKLFSIQTSYNFKFIERPKVFQSYSAYRKGLSISHSKEKKVYNLKCNNELHRKANKLLLRKKYLEIEMKDKVNENVFQNDKKHSLIRQQLVHDINPTQTANKINNTFYSNKENLVNYIEDILLVPHLQNKLLFIKKTKDKEIKQILSHQNCLSKYNQQSLNMERIKKLFTSDTEQQPKQETETETEQNKNLHLHQNQSDLYKELEYYDYFTKARLYKHTNFAKGKEKKFCYKLFLYNNSNYIYK